MLTNTGHVICRINKLALGTCFDTLYPIQDKASHAFCAGETSGTISGQVGDRTC